MKGHCRSLFVTVHPSESQQLVTPPLKSEQCNETLHEGETASITPDFVLNYNLTQIFLESRIDIWISLAHKAPIWV